MKHISILVPEGESSISNIEGSFQIFTEVNTILQRSGKAPIFTVQLIGLTRDTQIKKFFNVHADLLIDEVQHTDLIIIPAIQGNFETGMKVNKNFIPWIIQQYKQGAAVASLCVGSFLLAATGLLDGKRCATHWVAANDFRKLFPEVTLVPDKVVAEDHGIYSSGGAYSSLNLILYLVEKYAGRDMAITCSKLFQIEFERNSQSVFMIFNPQKDHEDDSIKKAQEFIEHHFREKITVDQLARQLAIGRRNLERRFKKATSNTVVEYIQRVKIEAAKMSLESTRENVNEVMYNVGYTDTKAFRTTFKKITGVSPVEYRNKYKRIVNN